jgi:hypothetical protein
MEKKIAQLENKLKKRSEEIKDPLLKLTYKDVSFLSTEKLLDYQQQLLKKINTDYSIYNLFSLIVASLEELKTKLLDSVDEIIIYDLEGKYQEHKENLQYALVQQIVNFEIDKRLDSKATEAELELLEQKIMDLEKDVDKVKDIQLIEELKQRRNE